MHREEQELRAKKRAVQAAAFFGMSVVLLGYAVSVEKERYVLPGPLIGLCCLASLGFAFSCCHEAGALAPASLSRRGPRVARPAASEEQLAKLLEDRATRRPKLSAEGAGRNGGPPQQALSAEMPSEFLQASAGAKRERELAQQHPPFFADLSSILAQPAHAEESLSEFRNVLPDSVFATPRRGGPATPAPGTGASTSASHSSDYFKRFMDNQSTAVDRLKHMTADATLEIRTPALRKRF